MIRYFVYGEEVTREQAMQAWMVSRTYHMAAYREAIFPNAEAGVDRGGVANHLREAGIRIEVVADREPQGGNG